MNINNNKRIIAVLGMHRSGTSVITRALKVLGVGLGENLHPAGFDNPKGFWEDRSILEINEQLLGFLGTAYDRLGFACENIEPKPEVSSLKLKATQIIARKIKECGGVWGFKDPRTCRLLSFWMEIFQASGCEVSFVIALRNPASVAASLKKRNNMPAEKAYILWLQHMLPAVLHTNGADRVIVDYDNLLDAPYEEIARLSAAIGLSLPSRESLSVLEFENEFLETQLRHTRFSSDELLKDSRAPAIVSDLYLLLSSVANDRNRLESPNVIDAISNIDVKFSPFSPIFDYVNLIEDSREELCIREVERDRQIANLKQTVAERDGEITSLTQTMAERDGQIAALNQAMAERDGKIENFHQALAERDRQIESLHQAVAERDGQVTDLNSQINVLLGSKSWQLTKPFRYIRRKLFARLYVSVRRNISDSARRTWRRLPLSIPVKQKIINTVFTAFPFIFGWTEAYRSWKSFSTPITVGEYIPLLKDKPLSRKPAKLICFYLPQFHPIPENDAWWGKGFTEWTNVRPAQPQFEGHYQPRIPGELGYYNLLEPELQRRQVELAKLYGIEGFCFYFYWFGGKRLLEAPLENYLNDSNLNFPFCLCWANENWSRRWDGMDSEILIAQKHSPDDDLAFINHVAQYMRDPRYICINGRPLLLVYRPSLLPSAKDTAHRWRTWCRKEGIGDIYLAYTQSFEIVDPEAYGFDAAIEFPPNNSAPPNITGCIKPRVEEFRCTVYDWRVFVERSEQYKQPGYTLFRGVCPSWDNTARRKNQGTVFINSSPTLYQRWLENAIHDTEKHHANPDKRLIFVNAWNEWAEGAYLEPDEQYGYSWLQATRDALSNAAGPQDKSILIVTHDCHPHGAQMLILETAKQLKIIGFKVSILALDGGKLINDFIRVGHTINAGHVGENVVGLFLDKLRSEGTLNVITNTVVSGRVVLQLNKLGFRILSLIHELPGVIRDMKQEANAEVIARYADKVIFPADMVYKRFCEIARVSPEKAVIRPQGVLRKNPYKHKRSDAYRSICKKHNLPLDTQIVLNIAYVDNRKGPDLFVEIASQVLKLRPKTTFIWIGHSEKEMLLSVKSRINELGIQKQVLFVGFEREPMAYYAAASVYALTSREDPFPNVVLESAEAGVPVVAFHDASGASEFIIEQGGRLAAYLDTHDFARNVCELLGKPVEKADNSVGSLQQYALDLLYHLNGFPRVSVVVPNYNYNQYIVERLDSIYCQNHPIYEVIVLDDASTDKSVKTIESYFDDSGKEARLVVNTRNSGSVFRQWQKGIGLCKGDLIWIAEADDLSDNNFLSELTPAFHDTDLVLAYSQSKQIDDNGDTIAQNYLDYTKDVSECWLTDYKRPGCEEISEALAIKNIIPNVSAVLFRRRAFEDALAEIGYELFNYQVAGDWLVYLHILHKGNVYFNKKSLNLHRRHTESVTKTLDKLNHIKEIESVQATARVLSALSIEVTEKADAYIRYLYELFDIPYDQARGQLDAKRQTI